MEQVIDRWTRELPKLMNEIDCWTREPPDFMKDFQKRFMECKAADGFQKRVTEAAKHEGAILAKMNAANSATISRDDVIAACGLSEPVMDERVGPTPNGSDGVKRKIGF